MRIVILDPYALEADTLRDVVLSLASDADVILADAAAMPNLRPDTEAASLLLIDFAFAEDNGLTEALAALAQRTGVILIQDERNRDEARPQALSSCTVIDRAAPKAVWLEELGRAIEAHRAMHEADRDSPASGIGRLSERQREILSLLCLGLSNKDIAGQLSISEGTVKVHLHAIYKLLGVRNRTQAAHMARRLIP